jgi:membrane protein implicated in regulation of membrane protease activity
MNIDQIVFAFAGSMVVASLLLAHFVSPWWLLLAAFVGLNSLQAAFTGFCPLALILRKLGRPSGAAFH